MAAHLNVSIVKQCQCLGDTVSVIYSCLSFISTHLTARIEIIVFVLASLEFTINALLFIIIIIICTEGFWYKKHKD